MTTRLVGPINSGPASGGAGVATSTGVTNQMIVGEILGVYAKYNHAPPAGTTGFVLATQGTSPAPPTYDILNLAAAATDGWFYPEIAAVCEVDGTPVAGQYAPILVHDFLSLTIDGADDLDNVDAWILLREP